jgi:hypothetical protein
LAADVDIRGVPKVLLEYPNGRRHEIDFDSEQPLDVGDSFELYGRRWRVMSVVRPRRAGERRYHDTNAIVCRPITTSSPLARVDQGSGQTAK